jgi:4-hydroxybenzoyl-CoA reductase subunit beta
VKWAVRKSIDYPLVSVALRFDLDGESGRAPITRARAVVGVLAAKPKEVAGLDALVAGRSLSDPFVAEQVSERAFAQCKPVPNVPYDPAYRRRMIQVLTRRAIERLAQD